MYKDGIVKRYMNEEDWLEALQEECIGRLYSFFSSRMDEDDLKAYEECIKNYIQDLCCSQDELNTHMFVDNFVINDTSIKDIDDELQDFIDGKIETYEHYTSDKLLYSNENRAIFLAY